MAKKPAKIVKKSVAKPTPKMVAKKPEPVVKLRKVTTPKNTNTMSYTFSEFVENVRGFCGLMKRSEAKVLVEDIALLVKDSLRRGYKIPLFGLGKMYVRKTKPRQGRNPATGELIDIPARKRVRFTAAKALKEAVL